MEQFISRDFPIEAKVYQSAESGMMSILDMLDYFEKYGVMRVSDLHIKVGVQPAYRIDGNLVKLKGAAVSPEIIKALLYPLLTEANREKLNTESSVDCSYHYKSIHFRINVFKENDGISAAIRALSKDIPRVEEIGFPNDVWKDIINLKSGLVLVTGITGAGKSTTISSFIDRIASNRACRVITIEDPIEYVFDQKNSIISQREIGRDVKSFQDGLRSMLREDPDVIFVGEMRDVETISHDADGGRDRSSCFFNIAYPRRDGHHNAHPGLFRGRATGRGAESIIAESCVRGLPETYTQKR